MFNAKRGVTFKAGAEPHTQFDLPALPSGFYYGTLELWTKAGKLFDDARAGNAPVPDRRSLC